MIYILIYLFLAVGLDMIQFKISFPNYWVPWNGIGVTDSIWKKQSLAPMQYRILVPGLYSLLVALIGSQRFYEKRAKNTMFIYEPLKILFMFLGLCGFHIYLTLFFSDMGAFTGTLLLALFWVTTFKYDYADCYLEIFFWALFCYCAGTGQFHWAAILFFLSALNRELTVLLVPLYYLITQNIFQSASLLLIFIVVYGAMYLYFGRREKYCSTKEIYNLNRADVRGLFAKPVQSTEGGLNFFPFNEVFLFTVILVGTILLGLNYENYPQLLRSVWLINIPFMVLVFVGARITELRVLMPLSVSVIPSTLLTLGG